MKYLKKKFDDEADQQTRVNLSTRDDARIPGADPNNARVLPVPQCDWCGDERPVWLYAATRMTNGDPRHCWRWATCERCDRMVEHANWDAVHRRMVHRFKRIFAAQPQGVSDALVNEAVYHALDDFHKYAVRDEASSRAAFTAILPGGGKTIHEQ